MHQQKDPKHEQRVRAQCIGSWEISSLVPHREFLAMVGSEKARATNMNCEVVAVVKHDKSTPLVDITYSKKKLSRKKNTKPFPTTSLSLWSPTVFCSMLE